ncbi:MAG: hypothetical protein GF364_14920 [Candidatus Lokiarchaeota archaeon]|nr:hypothetical protein [Candidatus Lokiarchaeota archaeon]
MSYIPKYILKRMLPKDGIVRVPDGIELNLINVLSPLSIDEIPEDYLEYLDYLKVLIDGEPISNDVKVGIEIKFEGEIYGKDNLKDAIGKTIPVGGKLTIFVPITTVNSGENHDIEININLDSPISIKVNRTIQ